MARCYVYIIECKSPKFKPVKIGIANNPEKRIEEIQTGCPFDLMLVASIEMPSRAAAFSLESYLHRKFRRARMNGEWFKLKDSELSRALNQYHVECGIGVNRDDVRHSNKYGSKTKTKQVNDEIEAEIDSKIDLSWI